MMMHAKLGVVLIIGALGSCVCANQSFDVSLLHDHLQQLFPSQTLPLWQRLSVRQQKNAVHNIADYSTGIQSEGVALFDRQLSLGCAARESAKILRRNTIESTDWNSISQEPDSPVVVFVARLFFAVHPPQNDAVIASLEQYMSHALAELDDL